MTNPIQRLVELAALRQRVAELESENRILHTAVDEATEALREAQRTLLALGDAEIMVETPRGETIRRRLRDCLTTTLAAPTERRN